MAKMKTIYFVRHGQSQANVDKIFAGSRLDSPLTTLGLKQAEELAARLQHMPIDSIVSSPLKRARQTAECIAQKNGYRTQIRIQPLLAERDFGEATGKSWQNPKLNEQVDNDDVDGLETIEQLAERVRKLFVWFKTLPEEHILIVGHGSLETMLYVVYKGLPLSQYLTLEDLKNGSIRKYLLD